MKKIGVIGYGLRAGLALSILPGEYYDYEITAILDIDQERASERLREFGHDPDKVHWYTSCDEMFGREKLDGVFIGTHCNMHTHYAIEVIRRGIPLFLEKPVAINLKQLERLSAAAQSYRPRVVVSFPLRTTPIFQKVKELLDAGTIGAVQQVQAVNNVPYGGVYYQSWYRNDRETGGLFLQKATHDLDYITYALGLRPVMVSAMCAKTVFKGNKPAELKCADCQEKLTCPEGPFVTKYIKNDTIQGDYCCFATDTGNHDSASVLVQYESGIHAVYTQNFIARKQAAKRGARFIGYRGTLEFDWYKDEIQVFMHDSDQAATYRFDSLTKQHFGGDMYLMRNFYEVMSGTAEPVATLEEGIQSAAMCLMAEKSAQNHSFESMPVLDSPIREIPDEISLELDRRISV